MVLVLVLVLVLDDFAGMVQDFNEVELKVGIHATEMENNMLDWRKRSETWKTNLQEILEEFSVKDLIDGNAKRVEMIQDII
ncbi:hypothetical protein BDD12DRAFT_835805, partial [Trichophaea hybrida]